MVKTKSQNKKNLKSRRKSKRRKILNKGTLLQKSKIFEQREKKAKPTKLQSRVKVKVDKNEVKVKKLKPQSKETIYDKVDTYRKKRKEVA